MNDKNKQKEMGNIDFFRSLWNHLAAGFTEGDNTDETQEEATQQEVPSKKPKEVIEVEGHESKS